MNRRKNRTTTNTLILSAMTVTLTACGVAQLQTARTVAPGSGQISISAGYLYNRLNKKRSHSLANFPIEAHSRWGLIPKLDIGVSVFDLAGGQIDLKYNFLPETNPAALALSGGIGAAWDWAGAGFFRLPVTAHFSYDVKDMITPYLALGWQIAWVVGYDPADPDDTAGLERPSGKPTYGDHMLTATAGLSIRLDDDTRLLLEYDYSHQFVDDPRDGHAFVDNHVFVVGVMLNFTFRQKPPMGPPRHSPPGTIIPPPLPPRPTGKNTAADRPIPPPAAEPARNSDATRPDSTAPMPTDQPTSDATRNQGMQP